MPKAMILTVGTGRNRKDIAGAISLSISRENPDKVIFLTTEKSSKETIPEIDPDVLNSRVYEDKPFAEENDVEEIYLHYLSILKSTLDTGYTTKEIVIDYTSGTKSMTAALFAAGLSLEIESISYIAGKRDEGGRVIPGTERPISIRPVSILAQSKMDTARKLFNLYQFESAKAILRPLVQEVKVPEIYSEALKILKIVEAYSFWDTFHLKNAKDAFGEINSKGILKDDEINSIFQTNMVLLNQSAKNKYSVHRLVDLLENAHRRVREGKFDDAVARIYRLFEFMAQIKLYKDHKKIETDKVTLKILPTNLHSKYEKKFIPPDVSIKLALVKSYDLLKDLKDQLGIEFMREHADEDKPLSKLLGNRNKSILAHGFTAISENDTRQMIDIAEKYLTNYFPEWESEKTGAEFPKL